MGSSPGLHDVGLKRGDTLGAYTLVRLLGSGSFGAVYEAVQQPLGKRVALKVMHAHVASDADAVHRFHREAQALVRLRHPHVVDVLDLGELGGRPFLAMEYLEGETLSARVRRLGPLPLAMVADLLVPICSAVAAAHALGIVHRDIKPDNILIAHTLGGDHPKLLDFGVARIAIPDSSFAGTATSSVLGTPYYMAPEQVRGSAGVGPHSDQWALAVVTWDCLLKSRLFDATALFELFQLIVSMPIPDPASLRADIPRPLADALTRALQRDPALRHPSVDALAQALLPFASPRVQATFSEALQAAPSALTGTVLGGPAPMASTLLTTVQSSNVEVSKRPTSQPARSRWLLPSLGGAAALVWLLGDLLVRTPSPSPSTPTPAATAAVATQPPTPSPAPPRPSAVVHVLVETVPPTASLTLDGERVGVGRLRRALSTDAAHRLEVEAPGYTPQVLWFQSAPPPRQVVLTPLPRVAMAPDPPRPVQSPRSARSGRNTLRGTERDTLSAEPMIVAGPRVVQPTPMVQAGAPAPPPPAAPAPVGPAARSGSLNPGEF